MSHLKFLKIGGSARTIKLSLNAIFASILLTQISLTTIAAEPRTFTKCWEYTSTPDLSIAPAADASNIYFVDRDSRVNAVEAKSGSKAWTTEIGGDVISNLLVVDGGLLIATRPQSNGEQVTGKTTLRAVSKQTGVTLWQESFPSLETVSLGWSQSNVVLVGNDGTLIGITLDGNVVWQKELKVAVTSSPTFTDLFVILGTANNELLRVSGANGDTQVVKKTGFPIASVGFDTQNRYLIGDERGNLIAIDADGEERWKFRNGARISSILLYDSEYIATSYDNFVYKLRRSGNVEWKRRLPGRLMARPVLIGDSGVASIVGSGSVFVFDLHNGKIFDRFETGEESSAGVAGHASSDAFAVSSSDRVYYFSRASCRQQKDGAESTPSSKKS